MAYYSYIEPVNDNLICCICRTPFIDPYCSRTCCHTFCRGCITTALSISSTCPVDRSHLTPDDLILADPLVRNLVNELPVECPNKEAGCEEKPQRQLLELHLRDTCKHTDTTEDEELSSGSEMRQTKGADDEHFGDSSTIRCEFCQGKVLRSESHTSCQETVVSCEHAANGCSWTGPRSELQDSHMSSCPYEAIKGFFAIHEQTTGKLKEENVILKQRVSELEGQIRVLSRESRIAKDVLEPWYRDDTGRAPQIAFTSSAQPVDNNSATFPNTTYSEETYLPAAQRSADQMASFASYFPSMEEVASSSTGPIADTHSGRLPATIPYSTLSPPFAHTSPTYQSQASHPSILPLPTTTISTSNAPPGPIASSSTLTPTSSIAPLNLSGNLFTTLTSLHNSLVTLSSSVDSLARQHEVHISTEAMRNNEELRSLRSVLHGLRIQVHSIMMERNAQITGRPGTGGQGMEGQGLAGIDGPPWLPNFGIPRFPHLGVPPPVPATKL